MRSSTISSLRFGREEEFAADEFGLELIAARYGDVGDAIQFFTHLESADEQGSPFFEFAATHPYSRHRIERLKKLIDSRGYRVTAKPH